MPSRVCRILVLVFAANFGCISCIPAWSSPHGPWQRRKWCDGVKSNQNNCFSLFLKCFFRTIVPLMHVQSCCNHIKENVEKKFGKNAAKVFGEAAQQALEADFYSKLAGLLSMFIFLSSCKCLIYFSSPEAPKHSSILRRLIPPSMQSVSPTVQLDEPHHSWLKVSGLR